MEHTTNSIRTGWKSGFKAHASISNPKPKTQNSKLKTQNSKLSSLSTQLPSTLRSCSDRRHDGVAQTARFQNLNSCHSCAPGAGDHFSQLCRVELRITDHLR